MNAALIAQLLATFGPSAIQLVTQLIALSESNSNVTSAQWAALIQSLSTPSSVVAGNALKAANVYTTQGLGQVVEKLAS